MLIHAFISFVLGAALMLTGNHTIAAMFYCTGLIILSLMHLEKN